MAQTWAAYWELLAGALSSYYTHENPYSYLFPNSSNDIALMIFEKLSNNELVRLTRVNRLWLIIIRPLIRRVVTYGLSCPDAYTVPNVEEILAYIPHRSAMCDNTENLFRDYRTSTYCIFTSIYATFSNLWHVTFRYYKGMEIDDTETDITVHVQPPDCHTLIYAGREMLNTVIVDTEYSKRKKYKDVIAFLSRGDRWNYSKYRIYYAKLCGEAYKYPLPNTIRVVTCPLITYLRNYEKILALSDIEALMIEIEMEIQLTPEILETMKKTFRKFLEKENFRQLNYVPKQIWLNNFEKIFAEYVRFETMS